MCVCVCVCVCALLVYSWCCKQVAIPLLVMVRPKGVCVGCPAATLQVLAVAYSFLAQTHWISACLMMVHGPKAMQLLHSAINYTSKLSPCNITIER